VAFFLGGKEPDAKTSLFLSCEICLSTPADRSVVNFRCSTNYVRPTGGRNVFDFCVMIPAGLLRIQSSGPGELIDFRAARESSLFHTMRRTPMYHHVDCRYAEVAWARIWGEAACVGARSFGGAVAQIWPVRPVFMAKLSLLSSLFSRSESSRGSVSRMSCAAKMSRDCPRSCRGSLLPVDSYGLRSTH